LETRKLQFNLALEERTKEIEIHKNMLRIQIKNAEDERHSAATELRDRTGKVDKLKGRYGILMTQFAPEDGEDEHTQAYYVIQAAQKREELQRDGDLLDANIRRAEKEIKALENTLKLMNNRNEQYRMKFYNINLVCIRQNWIVMICNTKSYLKQYLYIDIGIQSNNGHL
jgi:UDP-glucose:O-linked fucose beta-1,3-glucosyltransferase